MKSLLTIVIGVLLMNSAQAQEHKFAVAALVGLNQSDINYGLSYLEAFLPKDDYQIFRTGGDGGAGYSFGIEALAKISTHSSILLEVERINLGYEIEGEVSDFNPLPARPLSATIPVSAEGRMIYSFLGLQLGYGYSLGDNERKGLRFSAFIKHLIHLKSDWKVTATYEDGQINDEPKFIELASVENNNLWLLGLAAAYELPIKEQWSIGVQSSIQYGLNAFVEDGLAPTIIDIKLALRYWL